jgi:hypothetical protein
MCVDYTDLNKHCPKDPFGLPWIDQVIDSMAGCDLLCFLDCYSGYHQITIKEEDQEKTAFITPFGVYCYTTMSFRLKNAGATYQLHCSIMFIIRKDVDIVPHVAHNHREPLEQGIYGLTGEMSEVLVLSPVSRIQPCLNICIPSMSILQLQLNLARQILYLNPIDFRLTQSTVQVVDCLVVGIEHVTRSWSKEVHRVNISRVHSDIP